MAADRQFEFGPFRLEARTGQLWRDKSEVRLTPRAAAVLHLLAERAQQIVTKQDLFDSIWDGIAITDDALTSCIQELRRALGDDARRPHLIETRYRRGYRLMVPAICIGSETSVPIVPAATESFFSNTLQHSDDASRSDAWSRTGSAFELPDRPSIAVLPFRNMSDDPEQDYFVDGMVEEIIIAFSRIRWLFVIARNSSFIYKGKTVDVNRAAHELGVRYVLEGSVRKADNRVRIAGRLRDTTTAALLWADRFDGALDNVFELQDQVSSAVAGAIEPRLRLAEISRATRKPTQSLDAYDLYLRALAHGYQRSRDSFSEFGSTGAAGSRT